MFQIQSMLEVTCAAHFLRVFATLRDCPNGLPLEFEGEGVHVAGSSPRDCPNGKEQPKGFVTTTSQGIVPH